MTQHGAPLLGDRSERREHGSDGRVVIPSLLAPEHQRLRDQMLLIRAILGLSPIHDPVAAVRVLHDEGRAALERERGHRWGEPHA